jgi:malonate-semialdehyde dehydrogenase (acetylating)/methylmalonate-semialdehyde dehydrogenase
LVKTTVTTIEHRIGGSPARATSTRSAPVWNPATGEVQAEVLLGESSDVDQAVETARRAFADWRETSTSHRARVMFAFRDLVQRHAPELARVVAREHGKMVSDATGEIVRGMEIVEFACGIAHLAKGEYSDQISADVDSFSLRQPLGVCAGITPFNFPVMVPMWMHPIAIACGNTFVLKPSERDPSASNLIADLYSEAGLPGGVFNVVHGDKTAVDAILDHRDIAAVSFVGSTPVAKYVHARATAAGKRVQALGGAKNHAVIMPDADIGFAAEQLTAAAYGSAGQRCMAISAAVAVGDAAGSLLERLKPAVLRLTVGPGEEDASDMGPVVTAEARDRILRYIEGGERAGATLVVDGRKREAPEGSRGFFIGPTLFDDVTTSMDIYRDEMFGPVLVVLRVDSLEAAIDMINRNPYGNGAAIFTASGSIARAFGHHVQAGMIGINVPIPVPMSMYSFGGWKSSLFGEHHVHGLDGIRFYTHGKVVTARWPSTVHLTSGAARTMNFPTAS